LGQACLARASNAGARGPRLSVFAPPRTEFFFKADVASIEKPPHRAAAGAHICWDDPLGQDKNELLKVATRLPYTLEKAPSEWGPIVLWGHKKAGPFTVVEGNHRLIAYASSERRGLEIPVFVGLSRMLFFFHFHDSCGVVANDLYRR
jgi:hypothetical protein